MLCYSAGRLRRRVGQNRGSTADVAYEKRFTIVSGLYVRDDAVLLVRNSWATGSDWTLPGGRIELGESAEAALMREFEEETGLRVVHLEDLCYVVHSQRPDLGEEAVILAFRVARVEGELTDTGDPFVTDVAYWSFNRLGEAMKDPSNLQPLRDSVQATFGSRRFYEYRRSV